MPIGTTPPLFQAVLFTGDPTPFSLEQRILGERIFTALQTISLVTLQCLGRLLKTENNCNLDQIATRHAE